MPEQKSLSFPTPEHIKAAQDVARSVQAKTGGVVPGGFYAWPSIALVQAKWESDSGRKVSGKWNFFGIKATGEQIRAGKATLRRTREVIGGKDVMLDAWFADYGSLREAYEAHAMLFVRVGVYKPALKATNAEDFLRSIAPHYATDPTYFDKLSKDARAMGLYRYDEPKVLPKAKASGATAGAIVVAAGSTAASMWEPSWRVLGVVGAIAAVGLVRFAVLHGRAAAKFNQ